MASMSSSKGRAPDQFDEHQLLAGLTLRERYAHGFYMDATRVSRWLGKPTTSVARWRLRNQFPRPAGKVVAQGRYKETHGWCPREILGWLRRTGRLVTKSY